MKKTVTISKNVYVLSYEGSDFSFWLDLQKSGKMLRSDEFSDFTEDSLITRVYGREFTDTKTVLKLYREVNKFVEDMIKMHKPYFFTYSASTPEKIDVYAMFAEKLAKKLGYMFYLDGKIFKFYKI